MQKDMLQKALRWISGGVPFFYIHSAYTCIYSIYDLISCHPAHQGSIQAPWAFRSQLFALLTEQVWMQCLTVVLVAPWFSECVCLWTSRAIIIIVSLVLYKDIIRVVIWYFLLWSLKNMPAIHVHKKIWEALAVNLADHQAGFSICDA